MEKVKFGTDGWRSVIADGFTVPNVARIASASSRWLINQKEKDPSVIIGYDTRFGGEMFAITAAKIFALAGNKVYLADRFVSTPMVSYGIIHKKASLGVMITASHNPYYYNGFKLKGSYGGPMLDPDIRNIEYMVPGTNEIHLDSLHFDEYLVKGNIEYINLEDIYLQHIRESFNLESISKSGLGFAFDAMYGSAQNVMGKLLQDVHLLRCSHDYTFGGTSPEPLAGNLKGLSSFIKRNGKINCGLAVDGDGDRLALMDEYGNYVDSHNIILLLIHYLHKYRGYTGKVIAGFSSTLRIERLCQHYGLDVQRVRIGFKEICSIMLKEKVLVGGEESGGISVFSHMPERDGIWVGLLIWQFMVETGKSLSQLIDEVYSITGPFVFERADLPMQKNKKNAILERCRNGQFETFGSRKVQNFENLDGFKFFFNEDEWLMVRSSGTEPVLRIYAESASREATGEIISDAREILMSL